MITPLRARARVSTALSAERLPVRAFEQTNGTLQTFLLAMVRNPHVYKRAQEEMDHVVGRDRLPNTADRDALPYLNAIIEELYRWRPGVPLGEPLLGLSVEVLTVGAYTTALPHRLMSDDEYRGFNIPGGCMIMPNIWFVP